MLNTTPINFPFRFALLASFYFKTAKGQSTKTMHSVSFLKVQLLHIDSEIYCTQTRGITPNVWCSNESGKTTFSPFFFNIFCAVKRAAFQFAL